MYSRVKKKIGGNGEKMGGGVFTDGEGELLTVG
jgi:hypothetical protein